MEKRIPFNVGDTIKYCGETATVANDDGGNKIEVIVDGATQNWYYEFEGVKCELNKQNIQTVATDWSEPYLKLEQSHRALKDALNQERYDDAEELTYLIAGSLYNLQAFIGDKVDG